MKLKVNDQPTVWLGRCADERCQELVWFVRTEAGRVAIVDHEPEKRWVELPDSRWKVMNTYTDHHATCAGQEDRDE